MIRLSSKDYILKNVDKEFFWKELNSITAGQEMNPEFGYTTQHYSNFDNVFSGRKRNDQFSIFLYRPITRGFRTEILAKGKVFETKNDLKVDCNFEIPFYSFLMFVVLGLIFTGLAYFHLKLGAFFLTAIGVAIYLVIMRSNQIEIKSEIEKQFQIIEKKSQKTVANKGS